MDINPYFSDRTKLESTPKHLNIYHNQSDRLTHAFPFKLASLG